MGKIFTNLSDASNAWNNGESDVTWVSKQNPKNKAINSESPKKGKESKKK